MKIEFLYFEECPHHKTVLELLEKVLLEEGIDSPVEKVDITSGEEAIQHKFLGSPSVRIDGLDVEKEARDSTDYGEKCRIYSWDGIPKGCLKKEMIRDAIRELNARP